MGSVARAEAKHDRTRPTEYPNDLLEWRWGRGTGSLQLRRGLGCPPGGILVALPGRRLIDRGSGLKALLVRFSFA
jgi:hypothetical protein